MRVAIVHHWFVSIAGGERVADALATLFPEADVFTLFCDPDALPPHIKDRKIEASFLDRLPGGRRYHRHMLPLYPMAVESLNLSGYELILTSDSGPVKGVITDPGSVHICYCHSPMRYLWDAHFAYLQEMPGIARWPFALASHYVRNWDYCAAQRVDHFLANSEYVAARIKKYYNRTSLVVHPPINTSHAFVAKSHDEFYLSAGRLIPYKRTELLIEACKRLGRKLVVVGAGPEMKRLRRMAGPSIEFLGAVDDVQLRDLYSRCRALLFAADEDFGMVPLEAQAFGRPVIAYGKGGSLETVAGIPTPVRRTSFMGNQVSTGIFFPQQSVEAIADAIRDFESVEDLFDPQQIRLHACQFDSSIFASKVRGFVNQALADRPYAMTNHRRTPVVNEVPPSGTEDLSSVATRSNS